MEWVVPRPVIHAILLSSERHDSHGLCKSSSPALCLSRSLSCQPHPTELFLIRGLSWRMILIGAAIDSFMSFPALYCSDCHAIAHEVGEFGHGPCLLRI